MANIEDRVISAVLKDKQVHVLMQANVDSLFKTHADIWLFIKDYASDNGVVPPAHLVVEKFRDFTPTDDVGTTKHHLDELRENYLNESLKSILKNSASELQNGRPTEALNIIISQTSDLKKSTADIRDLDVVDIDDAIAHFNHIRELNESGNYGIRTGLKGLDDYLPSGIAPGNFGVIMAFPSTGKSWLALFLAVQAWKCGRKPMFVSLEMSESEVRNRAYTIMGDGRFSHRKLSAGEVDLEEFQRWGKDNFAGKPSFQIISNDGVGDVTPAVLRGKIDQYKPDIVFVDYIQLMQSNTRTDNEVVKIKNISRDLKLLAIGEQVPIIAIASATPDDSSDMHSVPTLGQVAWSKQLSYDADFVIALGRQPNSDIIETCMRKNRNGALGEFLILTDFNHGRFRTKDIDD